MYWTLYAMCVKTGASESNRASYGSAGIHSIKAVASTWTGRRRRSVSIGHRRQCFWRALVDCTQQTRSSSALRRQHIQQMSAWQILTLQFSGEVSISFVQSLFNRITSRRTRSLSNAVYLKRDSNVCACAVNALTLLLIVHLSLEIDSVTSISYMASKFLPTDATFGLFWRYFTAHAQFRPY